MAVGDLGWFDVLSKNARERSGAPAVLFEGRTVTHGEALARAERLAAGLAREGVRPGNRVVVLSQNRPEMLDVLGAAARLGAICVPVNWRLGADEVRAIVADADPAVVIAEAEFADAVPDGPKRFCLDAPPSGWRPATELDGAEADAPPPESVGPADPLLIIHTAAVEGVARGAALTHGNILAHDLQLAAAWALGPDDRALGALPLFHISGLGLALAVQGAGGATVLMRRFDPAEAARLVAEHGVTVACEFAPMLGQILDAAEASGTSLGSLKAVWGLDAPETIERFGRACPRAQFWVGYGQSETSGYVSFAPFRERPGSAGRPTPMARLEIVDEDDRPVPTGTVGEIVVRGPLVFAGYWRREADNAVTFRNGWHHTGDTGRLDPDGYLHYAGRSPAKELIKTGGENVYPAEVERALREHPSVAAACVFGVPDPRWGEAVVAVCERRPDAAVTEAELIAFVGERIARFKRPKQVVFVPGLPRTEAGLVDRAKTKAEFAGG